MAKPKSNKKTLIIILSIIVGFLAIGMLGKSLGWYGGKPKGKEVETAQTKLKTITSIVQASGKIQPEIEVIITPDVSGEITELYVQEGDMVKKNDILLRINPDVYQASVDQLRANVLSMKANLETGRANLIRSKANFVRQKELFEKKLVAEMDFITANASYEADKASLKASEYTVQNAEAQLDRAQKELQRTTILAPIDGTISKLNVEKGERVVGAIQMTGTEVMRIARLEQMEVQVKVNENDIVNVAFGDSAAIKVDSYPGRSFQGVVTEIANSATLTGNGTTEQVTDYDVKIRVVALHNTAASKGRLIQTISKSENKSFVPNFKPGMSGSVDIKTETVTEVVAVPIQAVTVRDYSKLKKKRSDKSAKSDSTATKKDTVSTPPSDLLIPKEDLRRVVFVVADGKVQMREVQTGISDDTHIQILSGLEAGEEVVVGSYRVLSNDLSDGDDIQVNNDKFKKINS